jgi:hypothetical protein
MRIRPHFASCAILTIAGIGAAAQTFQPEIPRAWDDKEVQLLELPLVQRDRSPRYVTAEQYYALKVRPIYRSYPAYVKGREPAGYLESLKQKEPEIFSTQASFTPRRTGSRRASWSSNRKPFSSLRPSRSRRLAIPPGLYQVTASFPILFPASATTCARRGWWKLGPTPAPVVTRGSCQMVHLLKELRVLSTSLLPKPSCVQFMRRTRIGCDESRTPYGFALAPLG